MQCFKGKINIFVKEKTLKLNTDGSYFKVYSHGSPCWTRTNVRASGIALPEFR